MSYLTCSRTPVAASISVYQMVAFSVAACLLFQHAFATDPTADVIRQELLNQHDDQQAAESASLSIWNSLSALEHVERVAILRDVLEQGPRTHAVVAAGMLIQEHEVESAPLIANRLSEFSPDAVSSLLRLIALTEQASEMTIVARGFLRQQIDGGHPYEQSWQDLHGMTVRLRMLNSIDRAAVILQHSGTPEDLELLSKAAVAYPESPEVWIALATTGGAMTDQLVALATTLYQDQEAPRDLRTAAAAAVASNDDEALNEAVAMIHSVIDAYGSLDLQAAVAHAAKVLDAGPPDETIARLYRFRNDIRILAMFRALPEDEAKDLAAAAIKTENRLMRTTAAMIAGDRWPLWFLEGRDHALTEEELVVVLALIGYRHPALRDRAREEAKDPLAVDALLTRIESDGLHTLGGDATRLFLGAY